MSEHLSPVYLSHITFESPKHTDFMDITKEINNRIKKADVKDGKVLINSLHTTLGLLVMETQEPNLFLDIKRFFYYKIPEDNRSFVVKDEYFPALGYPLENYLHRCEDNPICKGKDKGFNAASHIRALLTQPSIYWPIEAGQLKLGEYQGFAAVELDGRNENHPNGIRNRMIEVRIEHSGPIINLDEF